MHLWLPIWEDRATRLYREGTSDIQRRLVVNIRKRWTQNVEESNNADNEDGGDSEGLNAFKFKDDS